MTDPKPTKDLTTEELARRIFPKEVREVVKREAEQSDAKGEKSSEGRSK